MVNEGYADAYHVAESTGRNALLEAAAIGSCPCISTLVEDGGADVNMAAETDGDHPLLSAARAGTESLGSQELGTGSWRSLRICLARIRS